MIRNVAFDGKWCNVGCVYVVLGGLALAVTPLAKAQVGPLPSRVAAVDVDSGVIRHEGKHADVVWSQMLTVPDASWIRLQFQTAILGEDPIDGSSSTLRITALLDGGTQHLNAVTMRQWRDSSAYLNGNTLVLELIAQPNGRANRIVITEVTAGVIEDGGIATVCGPTDDRLPSEDARQGRLVPVGCTAWMIDDACGCFLTAGHCVSGGTADVVEFNVPFSNSNGSLNHPGPIDQYAVSDASLQGLNGGTGNDWGYFGCFPNSESGLTPFQAQGAVYALAAAPPPVQGQDIRITGYGTMSNPPEWNQVQKTHTGPFVTSGTTVQYQTDTTGGNSGSPVVDETTGLAIGIHTHGGCDAGGGQNSGTGINHSGLQNGLANPLGLCAEGLQFSYPNGRPALVPPAGGTTLEVTITSLGAAVLDQDTAQFHYDVGAGMVSEPLVLISGSNFEATFPAVPCGGSIQYYVSADTKGGASFTDPSGAPGTLFSAISTQQTKSVFDDDFEQDLGWTVTNENLADGEWVRGDPVGGGDRGDPPDDYDTSGQCFLTDNVDGDSDVDGGPTRLTSPSFDLSTGNALVSYARWFTNDDQNDFLVVEISNDDGGNWVTVETVGAGPSAWTVHQFAVSDFVAPTALMRMRFSVADQPNDSVTEAAIDAFNVSAIVCDAPNPLADLNCDGGVDAEDIDAFFLALGDPPAYDAAFPDCDLTLADINDDGAVDAEDIDPFFECIANGGCRN